MQQEDDLRGLAKVMEFMRAISIVFVVIHVYWFCYRAFVDAGINIGVVDKILLNFQRTAGLFSNLLVTKVFAVIFLALSCLGTKGVKKYLQRFPEKEKTQIGDDGAFLSGGERQKLVVARALLKDAPVMLFDEASSGFDVEANEYLYKIITEEMPEKSVIFITHHYDKLEKFDKVYLVKDGFLTEVRTGKM